MLTRTGTLVRKNRRRSSSKSASRRGSAPSLLQHPNSSHSQNLNFSPGTRTYLTPQPSPCKSVSFSFSSEGKGCPSPSPESFSVHQDSVILDRQYYGSVVLWKDAEPDHSFSFIASLCEASAEAEGACDFVRRAFVILGDTWPFTMFLGLLLALPITTMIVGVKYLDECPKEPKIPIYLVVGGCFGTIKVMMSLCRHFRRLKDDIDDYDYHDGGELMTMAKMASVALNVFLSIWFVFGNYWLFNTWLPKFKAPLHEPRNWCDKAVFTFTFWQLIVCYVLLGTLFCLTLLFWCCFSCLRCSRDPEKA